MRDEFDDIWPVSLITASAYDHMDTGPVVVGNVRTVVREGVTFFAIQDGGFWHHPGLQAFLGQAVCVHFDAEAKTFEVQSWPERQKIGELAEANN